nr:U-box domain-containing protein 28-like [Ipomoea batatas]
MARQKRGGLYVTVPSLFRCPISMDVMKSPVSLCTGVTYDRSSIQMWLSQGHNTCPATMQVLPSTDFVPNLTLRRLIHLWLHHQAAMPSPSALSKQEALDIIKHIEKVSTAVSTKKIADFVKYSEENRRFFANSSEAVSGIVAALKNSDEIEFCESIIAILDLILSENGVKEHLNRLILKSDTDYLSRFVLLLQKGSLSSKIQSARVLESIALDGDSQLKIAEKQGLLYELCHLISEETDRFAIEAGVSSLIAVSTSRPVKKELVRFGVVKTIGKILSGPETANAVMEKTLKLLETVATCTEGRAAIGADEECVTGIVKRLMKCSRAATEHGITVLWSVCSLARDKDAQEAVGKVNGITKVLLVMQSDCSAGVQQMCGDLVKVLRVKNSKSCLACYETKTTHITPY